MSNPAPAAPFPSQRMLVVATLVGIGALAVGVGALIRSDGRVTLAIVVSVAALIGAFLVLGSAHVAGRVAAFLAIAAVWTSVLLLALIFVGGHGAPCPELAGVGAPDRDDARIARMCEQRELALHPLDPVAANAPLSWVLIWAVGVIVAGGALATVARRQDRA